RTPAPDEAARLAREAAADGYRFIVSAGGDGTANEIANGIVGSGAVLALYPIGSGNDFARALGYPRRPRDVVGFLRSARRRSIDVGEMNGRIVVHAAGVGIDGHVAARGTATSRIVGETLGYFTGALVGIATYRPRPMRVLIDGELISGRFLSVVAANGTHFGSGMRIAPQASLDDGQLDVVLAGDLSPWASMVALGKIYFGTHIDGKTIILKRARAPHAPPCPQRDRRDPPAEPRPSAALGARPRRDRRGRGRGERGVRPCRREARRAARPRGATARRSRRRRGCLRREQQRRRRA